MSNGLVSIIIPIYNGEKWLKKAVNSALSQTYTNIEVILVDDGSSDNSLSVCKELSLDARIRIFEKSNGGQSSARNMGLDMSKGEYIQFLDCDDTISPFTCELALRAMKPETDFVLYGFNIYRQGKLLRTPHCKKLSYNGEYDKFIEVSKLLDSPCNKLFRRSYIKSKFREGFVYGEDGIFNYDNFTPETKIECIEDCLYNVTIDNPNSVNKRFKEGRLRDTICSLNTKLKKVEGIFGIPKAKHDYWADAITTLSFTIMLCASRSSYSAFCNELNQYLYSEYGQSLLNRYIDVRKHLKIHHQIIMNLAYLHMRLLIYVLSKILKR